MATLLCVNATYPFTDIVNQIFKHRPPTTALHMGIWLSGMLSIKLLRLGDLLTRRHLPALCVVDAVLDILFCRRSSALPQHSPLKTTMDTARRALHRHKPFHMVRENPVLTRHLSVCHSCLGRHCLPSACIYLPQSRGVLLFQDKSIVIASCDGCRRLRLSTLFSPGTYERRRARLREASRTSGGSD